MDNVKIDLEARACEDIDLLIWLRTGTVGAMYEHVFKPPSNIKCGYFFTSC